MGSIRSWNPGTRSRSFAGRGVLRGGRPRVRLDAVTDDQMLEAWNPIHNATPPEWFVGRPAYEERRTPPWSQYAFDTRERPDAGHRSREGTAVGMTEYRCLREMARCLRKIRPGRVPK
jgi:hypothetical protein